MPPCVAPAHDGGLQVLACSAGEEELRRGLVQPLHEVEVLDLHPAGAATLAASEGTAARRAPAEGLELDRALVLRVRRLTGDPFDLQEVVHCGHASPPGGELEPGPPGGGRAYKGGAGATTAGVRATSAGLVPRSTSPPKSAPSRALDV